MENRSLTGNGVLEKPTPAPLQRPARSITSLLPATYRDKDDRIIQPMLDVEFLQKELLVDRIDNIASWLWVCGRPMPPRPLHYQRLLKRDIFITETPGLHLVWSNKRIFLKPLPQYLLNAGTRADILAWSDAGTQKLSESALGFLHSYCALVSYESDFQIAKKEGLFPTDYSWREWQSLAAEVLAQYRPGSVCPRYLYGELRLSRLNKVYKIRKGYWLRGYAGVEGHREYTQFLRDHFGVVFSLLGYSVVVLAAMQVGLSTDLQYNGAFQSASYGFAVFSITAPLVGAMAVFVTVLVMFIDNFIATKMFEQKRFRKLEIVAPWKRTKWERHDQQDFN